MSLLKHFGLLQLLTLSLATVPVHAQDPVHGRQNEQGDLHARASRTGPVHDRISLPEGYVLAKDTTSLTANSSVAAVAEVISNACELGADKRSIYTRYRMRVKEVLFDDADKSVLHRDAEARRALEGREPVALARELQVVVPGGKVSFADGLTAQVDVLNVQHLQKGKKYLLYLHYSTSLKAFIIAGLSQGVYEVLPDGISLEHRSIEKTERGYLLDSKPMISGLSEARASAQGKR